MTILIFITDLQVMTGPLFDIDYSQETKTLSISLTSKFPFSFFRESGDLFFSQVQFHGNIWKGQVYLLLTDTWNSILAIPACQCTSLLLNPSEKSLSFADLPKVHGAQIMCTSSDFY